VQHGRRLERAIDVTNVRCNGAIHDFALLNARRDVPSTGTALRQAAAALAYHLRWQEEQGHEPPFRDSEHVGRFSEGAELLGEDDPEKHHQGRFREGGVDPET
jgi:hypothetical protein